MFATSGKRSAKTAQITESQVVHTDTEATPTEEKVAPAQEEAAGPSENPDTAASPKAKVVRLGQSACGCDDLSLVLPDHPFHPTTIPETLPTQSRILKGKVICLKFQPNWFVEFPFLHYANDLNSIICYYCAFLYLHNANVQRNVECTFIHKGFSQYKNAKEILRQHESSGAHKLAISMYKQLKEQTVDAQLSNQIKESQTNCRTAMLGVINAIRLLVRQGLALRGHNDDDGNLRELLQYTSKLCPGLATWLARPKNVTKFVSPSAQNEIIKLMYRSVLNSQLDKIRLSKFSVMCDGTRDCSGKEQESICIRWVDPQLFVHETFIGLYDCSDGTTGEGLANMLLDVFMRCGLSLSNLRGQAYDGAGNMAGIYNGTQSHILRLQPLAPYVHCASHCLNLVVMSAMNSHPLTRDSVNLIHEIGVFVNNSPKMKAAFSNSVDRMGESHQAVSIRPLCPTRWLVRAKAIETFMQNFAAILENLESVSNSNNFSAEQRASASGFVTMISKPDFLLAITMALEICRRLEKLNAACQGVAQSLSGTTAAVKIIVDDLKQIRNDDVFQQMFENVNNVLEANNLEHIGLPRQRRPPARLTGRAAAFVAPSALDHYRAIFFTLLDTTITQLQARFHQESMECCSELGKALLTGATNRVTDSYPELPSAQLALEIGMFRRAYKYSSIDDAITLFRSLPTECRQLFPHVEQLLRLLLVLPVSSASSERSFSSLRRLKTWLRATMTQQRLNHIAVLHTHQEELDALDTTSILSEFIAASDIRGSIFGR